MLKLPEFEYHGPSQLEQALELLERYGADARLVAGGTDLFPSMKQGLFSPGHVIGLRGIAALKGIRYSPEEGLEVGALTTLRELRQHPEVRAHYPGLAEAVGQIATVILQSMGTVGGNILLDTRCYYYNHGEMWRDAIGRCMKKDGTFCQVAKSSPRCLAVFSADSVPALMLYGARAEFVSVSGRREVALSELYQDDGMQWLRIKPGEILTSVRIPPPRAGWAVRYFKSRIRQAIDYPLVGVGVGVAREGGAVQEARVILNAIASQPVELEEAASLVGTGLEAGEIERIAELAYARVKPLTTHGVPPVYRKKMVRVTVRRALAAMNPVSGGLEV